MRHKLTISFLLTVLFVSLFPGTLLAAEDILGWDYKDDPYTLEWYVGHSWFGTRQWDVENQDIMRVLYKETGIKGTFITPTDNAGTKLNAMIASGDLPDLITVKVWKPQVQLLQKSNLVYPLNELIDKYNPDFWEIIPEDMVGWYTYDDGNWYGFPINFWSPEKMTEENYWEATSGIVAQKGIMEDLGIIVDDFKTKEGMMVALEKVKEANIMQNGVKVVPLVLPEYGGVEVLFTDDGILPNMFGIPREDKDGNLIDRKKHPEFLEMIKFANELFNKGLISAENFTSGPKEIDEKVMSGSAFSYIGDMGAIFPEVTTLITENTPIEYVPVGPVEAEDSLLSAGGAGHSLTFISKQAEDPAKLIHFFEELYDHTLFFKWGLEGVSYTIENGKVKYTEEYLKLYDQGWQALKDEYGYATFNWLQDPAKIQRYEPDPATVPQKIEDRVYKYFAQYAFDNKPFFNLEPTESDLVEINTKIREYWNEKATEMIMADPGEVDALYNEAIKQIDKMGWQKLYDAMNARFQENKKKLNIEYAWPANK